MADPGIFHDFLTRHTELYTGTAIFSLFLNITRQRDGPIIERFTAEVNDLHERD